MKILIEIERFIIHQNKIVGLTQKGPDSLLMFIEAVVGTLQLKDQIDKKVTLP